LRKMDTPNRRAGKARAGRCGHTIWASHAETQRQGIKKGAQDRRRRRDEPAERAQERCRHGGSPKHHDCRCSPRLGTTATQESIARRPQQDRACAWSLTLSRRAPGESARLFSPTTHPISPPATMGIQTIGRARNPGDHRRRGSSGGCGHTQAGRRATTQIRIGHAPPGLQRPHRRQRKVCNSVLCTHERPSVSRVHMGAIGNAQHGRAQGNSAGDRSRGRDSPDGVRQESRRTGPVSTAARLERTLSEVVTAHRSIIDGQAPAHATNGAAHALLHIALHARAVG
jgi:hypothetical protein